MDIFYNYIIVDEKTINNINGRLTNAKCSELTSNSTFIDSTPFASLKFDITIINFGHYRSLVVSDIGTGVSRSSEPLAQLIVWEWSQGTQFVKNKIILKKGGTTEKITCPTSIVIRILKKREVIEKPCPPLSSPDDDLTVLIGNDRLVVSAHQLMSVSPMINRMLSVDMKEKQQRMINLDGLGVSMEQFVDFLEAITIPSIHYPFFPNPKNVLDLLKLSDYFQVDWLKGRCGVHLVNCVEIPFVERFLLVERYRLDILKECFSRMLTELTNSK
uniref:BTB domain-containing protein n=1 Tax=Globodera pallida TaxID=36090 RepID=A0A183BZR5_GLOPA